MSEQPRDEERLTTADVAAAAEQRGGTPAAGPRPAEREVTRVEQELAPPAERAPSLLAADEANTFRARWDEIQTGFVDEPRQAVERADALVASAIKRLAEIFANERANLEKQWDRGDDISTEDLRIALQRYRSFFDRLLSV
jgi:hypothetical protein